MEIKKSLFDNLQNFFGFDNFKGEQEAIVASILNGRDTFVIMPTGGGKSICYQLPALMSDGIALVISPLIALMKNQVDQLRAFSRDERVAHFLNSSLSKTETAKVKEDVLRGATKLLYVAPESLAKSENLDFLQSITISFVAIDEAHCISEWGHDFRPEYRKIRQVITHIGENVPIIALTATATAKVQHDIQKNLQMLDAALFKSSFNRPNLFYEVRPKHNVLKDIVRFVKLHPGKSGIVYCLSRKKVEEVAEVLNINGIKALPYHAGLEPKVRAETQDKFLMEEVEVIVATIAFGMGIDKPDVRFVIHHDVPKSMEGYYQETGRAGRDGGEGFCLAFYSEKDVEKLSKFMKDKPVSEREIGTQILKEVIDYVESPVCRRKQILYYFGETFNEVECKGMCDNCKGSKTYFDATDKLAMALKIIRSLGERFDDCHVLDFLLGEANPQIIVYGHHKHPEFGAGKNDGSALWKSLLRQALLNGYLLKNADSYGILKLTDLGFAFVQSPHPVQFLLNKPMEEQEEQHQESQTLSSSSIDLQLLAMLKDLRKKVAKQKNVPPFVVFQDPSLDEMCIYYPTNQEELRQIQGVGLGKALRFGPPFIELIKQYVEDHDIHRPADLVIKSAANKSALKISIIQNIDRQVGLDVIASSKGIPYENILREVESIVNSGTKLSLNYYIDQLLDRERQKEVYDYFKNSEIDSVDDALNALGDEDYTREELQLMRIKFLSEFGN